jgi:uncharacterized membrane protein
VYNVRERLFASVVCGRLVDLNSLIVAIVAPHRRPLASRSRELCEISLFDQFTRKEAWTMAKITRSISISAPVEKVFAYMDDPTHMPEFWPSMIEVKDVKQAPEGVGSTFGWVYKMAGMRFEGVSETTEHIPNQRTATRSTKGIQSTFVWTYEPEDGGTKLTSEVEYVVPIPLLGRLAEAFILKQNEHEAETMLANLKARMET